MTARHSKDPPRSARPTFETVYAVGLSFLRQALRWLGVAKHDVDDVLQDVLIAAYRSLPRYNPAAALADAEASAPDPDVQLKRWLFGIAWRQVGHYRERAFRRHERSVGAGAAWPISAVDPRPSSEQEIADEQQGLLVGRLLHKLHPDRRLVLIQHDLLDIPVAEISRETGINENTLRNRLRLAREDFRVAVKRMNLEERLALRGSVALTFAESTRAVDPDQLLRAARVIPEVPEEVRLALRAALDHALAERPRRPVAAATHPSATT